MARMSADLRLAVPLVGVLLLGACGSDAADRAAPSEPPETAGAVPAVPLEAEEPVVGPCDPTVRTVDARVQIGAAGWDASDYPLEPPVAPPPGSCIRSVNDVPLDVGEPGPFGPRLWYYALAPGSDVEALCAAALVTLEADDPAGMNPDPCVPMVAPSTDPRLGSIVSHRFDVLRQDSVVVTVITAASTTGCEAEPEEQTDDEQPDCLTMLVGFLRYGP
jgi:hypothetical protein